MSEAKNLFSVLRQSADPEHRGRHREAGARTRPDRALCRVNVLDFAAKTGLDEERAIAAFLHAARLGIFELSWNVLCPGCGGVLDTEHDAEERRQGRVRLRLVCGRLQPTLDEIVEVTFTVSRRVRRIAAHDPDELPFAEYFRQIFWGSGIDLPDDFEQLIEEITLDTVELPPGEKALLSLQLPAEFVILIDPVTHATQFLDVKGEPTRERQSLSLVFDKVRRADRNRGAASGTAAPVAREPHRYAGAAGAVGRRRQAPRAARPAQAVPDRQALLTNQVFRDIYGTDTIDVDQRLKITSLTFLFTDLKGSTELYERVGDLVAFDLVRAHFQVLNEIVAAEAGAVVKTIGDAVMATFSTPDRAVAAALRMREAMRDLNDARNGEDLLLKIGIHEGPCLAVVLNDRQDYFGTTVNIAARVQGLADSRSILATGPVVTHPQASTLLENQRTEAGTAAPRAARHRRRDGGLRDPLTHPGTRFLWCFDERSQKPVFGSSSIGRSRHGGRHRRTGASTLRIARSAASMCWISQQSGVSTKSALSRPSFTPRGPGFSSFPGTCCARAAAACSRRPRRSRA